MAKGVPWKRGATLREKLDAATEAARKVETEQGCWEWPGYRNKDGYGRVQDKGGVSWLAHRAAYHYYVEFLHRDEVLHHVCINRACFRPDHTIPVSQAENTTESLVRSDLEAKAKRMRRTLTDLETEIADLEEFVWRLGLEDEWEAFRQENDPDPA